MAVLEMKNMDAGTSKSWLDYLSLLLAAFIGAIAAGGIQFWIEYWKNKKSERANQIQIHSTLLGCKHAFLQYLHSYFLLNIAARSSIVHARLIAYKLIDFTIATEYLEEGREEEAYQYVNQELKSKFDGSIDQKEALRSKEGSENLQIQIGNVKERFWKIIGQIKTSFEDTKIENFIKEIKNAEEAIGTFDKDIGKPFNEIDTETNIKIGDVCKDKINKLRYSKNPNKNRDSLIEEQITELNKRKDSMNSESLAKIDILESKIDNLLNYLENILANPKCCRDCNLFCSDKICPLKPSSQEATKE